MLQSWVSVPSPTQSSPPYWAWGLAQVLKRLWIPPAQLLEQTSKSVQLVQAPWTGGAIKKRKKKQLNPSCYLPSSLRQNGVLNRNHFLSRQLNPVFLLAQNYGLLWEPKLIVQLPGIKLAIKKIFVHQYWFWNDVFYMLECIYNIGSSMVSFTCYLLLTHWQSSSVDWIPKIAPTFLGHVGGTARARWIALGVRHEKWQVWNLECSFFFLFKWTQS